MAFKHVGLDWEKWVEADPTLIRTVDVGRLVGDYAKAREKLGWKLEVTFEELVRYVDARGMGVRTKVIPLMKASGLEPVFEASDDYVKTVLGRAKELEGTGDIKNKEAISPGGASLHAPAFSNASDLKKPAPGGC